MKEYKEIERARNKVIRRRNSVWVEIGIFVLIGLEVWEKFGQDIKVVISGFVQ